MSHFLYLHKDLTGNPNANKIGVTKTPYSAVRARQKFCWEQFGLDHLWIGFPQDISLLEDSVKYRFANYSGKQLQGFGTQTELFKVPINELRDYVNDIIKKSALCVAEVFLETPYIASNSGQCPFGIPAEYLASRWLDELVAKKWPDKAHLLEFQHQRTSTRQAEMIKELFDES